MRSPRLASLIAAALALTVIVVAGWRGRARADAAWASPSAVVYPPQQLPLTFSHARHLARGATCVGCHVDAQTSRSAVDNLMPTEAACTGCHAIDRGPGAGASVSPGPGLAPSPSPPATGRCAACHPGYQPGAPFARVSVPPPNLKFSHAAHRATDCRVCHGDLRAAGVGLATRDQLPRMRQCLSCHDDRRAASTCTTCHLAGVGGRVETEFRDGVLAPLGTMFGDAHGGDFRTRHAAVGQSLERYCATCHAERFCADCHQGTVKPLDFHAGDYVLTHAIEARRGTPDCSACHRQQSFCVGCHERSGVGARGGDFASDDPMRRFHPDGFDQRHGGEARRRIDTCASCHREDFCATCHSAEPTAARISPHPPGWRGSARCEALLHRAERMCLRCHIGDGEARCDR
jgi:hypothetical protein